MARAYRTVLLGFGKMAQGYSQDITMAHHYPYATHAQVLRDHPRFDWHAVVDRDERVLASASGKWRVMNTAATPVGLRNPAEIEVAILATPPDQRLNVLEAFPALRAVLVEKPLGTNLESALTFLESCKARNILVQVNLWRRADEGLLLLASGEMQGRIGLVQAASFVYGNGLRNNGTHMIDMARMLFGEIVSVQRIGIAERRFEGPLFGDCNPAFATQFEAGLIALFQPISFSCYRENGLTIWGENGCLEIMNEGLVIRSYKKSQNRAMRGESEISHDRPEKLESTVGKALYRMYDNLASALDDNSEALLFSSGFSAFRTTEIVEALISAPMDGRRVEL